MSELRQTNIAQFISFSYFFFDELGLVMAANAILNRLSYILIITVHVHRSNDCNNEVLILRLEFENKYSIAYYLQIWT